MNQIDLTNYEEFFISYMENELNESERLMVETFIEKHPELKQELALFEMTKLTPDESIAFPNPEILYRKKALVPFATILRFAVAAAVLALIITSFFYFQNQTPTNENTTAFTPTATQTPTPTAAEKTSSSSNSATPAATPTPALKNDLIAATKTATANATPEPIAVVALAQPTAITAPPAALKEKTLASMNWAVDQAAGLPFEKLPTTSSSTLVAAAPIKINKQGQEVIKLISWAGNKLWGDDDYNPDIHLQAGFFEFKHITNHKSK